MFSPPELHKPAASPGRPVLCIDPEKPDSRQGAILQLGSLPRETGIRGRVSLAASLCAEGSAIAAVSGHDLICAICLPLCLAITIWIYLAESQRSTKHQRRIWLLLTMGSSLTVSAFLVLLLLSRPPAGAVAQTGNAGSRDPKSAKVGGGSDDSYASVILWPKSAQRVKVISPPQLALSANTVRPSKPLVIPFNGVYWYLRSPATAPGRNAHIAHGSPARVEIHSSDQSPLVMEAHQQLALPIDPGCCRELDLSILNADDRPGGIRIAVELIDSSSRHVQSEELGSRPVLSSMPPEFSLNGPSRRETLKYPIPANSAIHKFDEIEVVFLPSWERSLGGVQIAIRSFRLLPK